MADFGYLSDTDDSAVDELVSQANELCALEQIAAINLSGFTDSTLPNDLESRFRRLKSLPALRSVPTKSGMMSHPNKVGNSVSLSDLDVCDGSSSSRDSKIFSPVKQNRKLSKEKRRIESSSSPPSDLVTETRLNEKAKSKSSSSSWFDKLSPSKIMGFIWRSPNKSDTKKKSLKSSKSFGVAATYSSGRERDVDFDEFLSDLNAFSVQDQRKMLKKALKQQQKMRKEAAEIIKLTKKASAKLDFDD